MNILKNAFKKRARLELELRPIGSKEVCAFSSHKEVSFSLQVDKTKHVSEPFCATDLSASVIFLEPD